MSAILGKSPSAIVSAPGGSGGGPTPAQLNDLWYYYGFKDDVINLYVSADNGDNGNDGLTPATPVASLFRAWELVPICCNQPVIVHFDDGEYEWIPPARFIPNISYASLTLWGDGAGQGAHNGFNVLAGPFTTIAGTSPTQLVLDASAGGTYDGKSVIVDIAGDRYFKTIHSQPAADTIVPLNAVGYPGADVDPGIGATVYVVEPAVVFNLDGTVINDATELFSAQGGDGAYTPVAAINVAFTESVGYPALVVAGCWFRAFGLELRNGILNLLSTQAEIGHLDPVQSGQWLLTIGASETDAPKFCGWGLSTPDYGFDFWSLYVDAASSLKAALHQGLFAPSLSDLNGSDQGTFGPIQLHGLSSSQVLLTGGQLYCVARSDPADEVPMISQQARLTGVGTWSFVAIEVLKEAASGSINVPAFTVSDGVCLLNGPTTIQSNSGGSSVGLRMTRGARVRAGFGTTTINGYDGNAAISCDDSRFGWFGSAACTCTSVNASCCVFTGNSEFAQTFGTFSCSVSGDTVGAGLQATGPVRVTIRATFTANGRIDGIAASNGAIVDAPQATITCTGNSTGVAFTANACGNFAGGASCTMTGGTYGAYVAGGGKVAFVAEPTACTGGTADLYADATGSGSGASSLLSGSFATVPTSPSAHPSVLYRTT